MTTDKSVSYLKVTEDASELVYDDGSSTTFKEGKPSKEAKTRLEKIKSAFASAFLTEALNQSNTFQPPGTLSKEIMDSCDELVDGVTQELGRALTGISILQMAIKSIEPKQSIRLHKGGSGDFSWVDGVSMRTLDATFVIPFLRVNSLLSINSYGSFMTRGLAENYPYSKVYKAALRGPKRPWLEVVEYLESKPNSSRDMLLYTLSKLSARRAKFDTIVVETEKSLKSWLKKNPNMKSNFSLVERFLSNAPGGARLLEVCIHSFIYTLDQNYVNDLYLKPMTQMRSANKKAKNIGDVELSEDKEGNLIVESWDAKFGTHYFLDELDFLLEKLSDHPECKAAGFITDKFYKADNETFEKIEYIREAFGVDVQILSLQSWVEYALDRAHLEPDAVANDWLLNIHSYLALKFKDQAPIDEPTERWLNALSEVLIET